MIGLVGLDNRCRSEHWAVPEQVIQPARQVERAVDLPWTAWRREDGKLAGGNWCCEIDL